MIKLLNSLFIFTRMHIKREKGNAEEERYEGKERKKETKKEEDYRSFCERMTRTSMTFVVYLFL